MPSVLPLSRFSKAFKTKGLPALARYLTTYKRGDLVDIKADPSIQVGMPYAPSQLEQG